ncbi:MAG TPA: hypothetical protein DCO79_04060, partial [Spirochaeta sp.]|nr:hypothetical protein [Spirochaeta sp.]
MINSWKNNLLSLPDSIFFDIMRNYLGDLKTPFNKHDLIRSLTSLVSKKEVRNRIFALIDSDDSRLLTAIALLDSSGIEELYDFTKQYYSFLELHNRIANLQERLLICIEYPDQNSLPGKKLIKLNPVFEDDLTRGYLDNLRIFSTLSTDESFSAPFLNEQFIAAFISFAMNNRGIFASSGNARKKAEAMWMNIFRIQHEDKDSPIFIYLAEVCRKLGFISADSDNFAVKLDQINNFGQYPANDRNIMLAAAAVSSFHPEQGQSFETASKLMFHLFKSLPNGSRLHENDLKSFFYLIRRSTCKTHPDAAEFTDELITDALSYYGYLIKEDDFRLFSHGRDLNSGEKLRIQSNFEISAPAGFSLAEEIHTACCSEIKNYDITRTYELTKSSFAAALDAGLQPEDIEKELLESASGSIPQNIGFSMKAWAREYESIRLNYGIVMTV